MIRNEFRFDLDLRSHGNNCTTSVCGKYSCQENDVLRSTYFVHFSGCTANMVMCIGSYHHTAGCLIIICLVSGWAMQMSYGGARGSYPRQHPAQILMLGVSSFRSNGWLFGVASTGIDVEGPRAARGVWCTVECVTSGVSLLWIGGGLCDDDGSCGVIRCFVGRDERDGVNERLRCSFVLLPFSPAPVDRPWYTIADRFTDDFPLASMFRYASREHFSNSNSMTCTAYMMHTLGRMNCRRIC